METTAAMPRIMEAMNRSNRTLLALASRHAILKSQGACMFSLDVAFFKMR